MGQPAHTIKSNIKMKNFNIKDDNIGGLLRMYAIPVSSFLRIRKDYINNLQTLEVRDRDSIIAIPIMDNQTFGYTQDHDLDEGGDYWEPVIDGIIPGGRQSNEDIVEELERGEWLVMFEDQIGTVHISGTKDIPMKFTTSETSGTSSSDRNQISFEFKCRQNHPPLILTNDMDDL
jgi:hypothetical protein